MKEKNNKPNIILIGGGGHCLSVIDVVEQEDKVLAAEKHVDELVQKGLLALEEMRKLNQEQVDYIVAKASVAALDAHGILAQHAVEETGRGVFEDKATKNLFACEHVVNNMRHAKTTRQKPFWCWQ